MKKVNMVCGGLTVLALLCLALPPLLESMQGNALGAYGIICVFCILGIGMMFLVIRRKALADSDVASRVTLLEWRLPAQKTQTLWKRPLRALAILLAVVCAAVTILLLWLEADPAVAIPLGGFILLAFGAVLIHTTFERFTYYGGANGFRLCHNALYFRGTRLFLDGQKAAIFEVSLNKADSVLRLGLLHKNAQNHINIPVPKDNLQQTEAFIDNLESHFEQEKEHSHG